MRLCQRFPKMIVKASASVNQVAAYAKVQGIPSDQSCNADGGAWCDTCSHEVEIPTQ